MDVDNPQAPQEVDHPSVEESTLKSSNTTFAESEASISTNGADKISQDQNDHLPEASNADTDVHMAEQQGEDATEFETHDREGEPVVNEHAVMGEDVPLDQPLEGAVESTEDVQPSEELAGDEMSYAARQENNEFIEDAGKTETQVEAETDQVEKTEAQINAEVQGETTHEEKTEAQVEGEEQGESGQVEKAEAEFESNETQPENKKVLTDSADETAEKDGVPSTETEAKEFPIEDDEQKESLNADEKNKTPADSEEGLPEKNESGETEEPQAKIEGESEEADKKETDEGQVFTVDDDDGKEEVTDLTPPDEEFYKTMDTEELEWYKEHAPNTDRNLHCTACFKQVTHEIGAHQGICRHPVLGVGICKQCRVFYNSGNWQKDEDGCDLFCRWCAEGGELILCDKCPTAFCKRCLQRNLGRKFVSDATSAEEWKCLVCDPKQIYELRALYHAIYANQAELLAKKLSRKKGASENVSEPGGSFIGENLTESYAILDEYRKALDDVKECWDKTNGEVDLETLTTLTRKLRKIYAVAKQGMDQMDKAVVTGYVSNYPRESKRIHMGKVDANMAGDDGVAPTPKRRQSAKKQKSAKKKPTPKKIAAKKGPAKKAASKKPLKVPQKSGKKKTIVVNGKPVTGEYVRPSLMGGKKKAVPKRRAAQPESDDSDIEIIGSSAPPPLKKRKTGSKAKY